MWQLLAQTSGRAARGCRTEWSHHPAQVAGSCGCTNRRPAMPGQQCSRQQCGQLLSLPKATAPVLSLRRQAGCGRRKHLACARWGMGKLMQSAGGHMRMAFSCRLHLALLR
jgi:hypothetical protein